MLKTGFAIAPGPMLATIISPINGRLADRHGNAPILVAGGVFGVIGAAMHLAWTGTEPSYVLGILIPGLFIGVSAGCSFAMLVGAAMRDVQPQQFGMAGAGRTTIFQLGIALGVAIAKQGTDYDANSANALSRMLARDLFDYSATVTFSAKPIGRSISGRNTPELPTSTHFFRIGW